MQGIRTNGQKRLATDLHGFARIYICGQLLFLGLLALPANSIAAESKIAVELTLEKAVEIALQKGQTFRTSEEALNIGRAQYNLSLSDFTPKSSLALSAERQFDRSGVTGSDRDRTFLHSSKDVNKAEYQWKMARPFTETLGGNIQLQAGLAFSREYSESMEHTEKYALGPSISMTYKQPLTSAGRTAGYSPVHSVNYTWESARIRYENTLQDIVFNVINSYYSLVKSGKLVALLRENLKQTERQLELAKTQFKLGVLAEIEVMKMDTQLARDRSDLIDAEKRLMVEEERFAVFLGERQIKRVVPVAEPRFEAWDIGRDESISTALRMRKEVENLDVSRKLALLDVKISRSTDDPDISFFASYKKQGEAGRLNAAFDNFDHENWAVGTVLKITVDDHGITRYKTEKSLNNLSNVDITIEQTKDKIVLEVDEALRNMESARKRYEILEQAMGLSKKALNVDELRFKNGVISTSELQRTQLALLQLKVDHFNAITDYNVAQAALKRAMGILGVK